MPIFLSLHNPAPPPTLSPSFHNKLKKHTLQTIIQPSFHNNLSTQSFQPSFQNSLNMNHSRNHFEDDTQLNNLQKDFQQATYITKNLHPTKQGQGPPDRIYMNLPKHFTQYLRKISLNILFPLKGDFPRNLHKVLCKCFFKRVLQKKYISF